MEAALRCKPLLLSAVLFAVACAPLRYDLSTVPVPVSAKPAGPGASEVVPFRISELDTLWVHGLFGRNPPDVAALVEEVSRGYDRIADFRVSRETSFGHWLQTHLTLTLIRMKRVVIEGQLVRD